MIKLEVEEYCHDCPYFLEYVKLPDEFYIGSDDEYVCVGDTIIRCKHHNICKRMANLKGESNGNQADAKY